MLTNITQKAYRQKGEVGVAHQAQSIHYVLWESQPGGMESYVTHYTRHFGRNTEVYIYSLRPSTNGLNENLDAAHFNHGSRNNWACYTGFFRYARKHRHDLFHLLNGGPIILLLLLLAGARKPVYHIHGTKYWKTPLNKLLLKSAWRIASFFDVRYIANSHYSAEIFNNNVLPKSPKIIHNGFEIPRFLEKRHLRKELKRMAYIGRLDKDKNVDLAIRLFEEVAGDDQSLELHIAGTSGIESQLRQQAAKSPYASRIRFHGWIKDISAFYASVDLFIFLSSHESFGNVIAEALLTGLPVLTSNVPVFREIYGEGQDIILGDPSDYETIRQNFLKSIADYPSLAQNAYQKAGRIIKLFDLENHLLQIERVYHSD